MKFSDLRIIQRDSGTAVLLNGGLEVAQIACNGNDEVKSYQSDAMEAAELLKAFFEAKEAGKVARLVVEEEKPVYCNDSGLACETICNCSLGCKYAPKQRPKNTTIDQMNDAKAEGERIAGLIWGDRAADITKPEYARILVGHWATLIYASGRIRSVTDCVTDAKAIYEEAQKVEL